jgi:hypothetical protein
MRRSKETGAWWLNNLPNTLNSTVLSEEEFRDSLRLRFGISPLNSHRHVMGVGRSLTSTTPRSARREASYYTATTEWGEMCAHALKPSAVSDEPFIHTDRDTQKAPGATVAPIDKDL